MKKYARLSIVVLLHILGLFLIGMCAYASVVNEPMLFIRSLMPVVLCALGLGFVYEELK